MNWLKVVRVVRYLVWTLTFAVAFWTLGEFVNRSMQLDVNVMQQSARATTGILEQVSLLIMAIALDRILELRERGMLENAAKQTGLPAAPV